MAGIARCMGEGNIHLKWFARCKFGCVIQIIVYTYAPFNVVPYHRYGCRWGKVGICISKNYNFSNYWRFTTGLPLPPTHPQPAFLPHHQFLLIMPMKRSLGMVRLAAQAQAGLIVCPRESWYCFKHYI